MDDTITLSYANYLQVSGVRPGPTTLAVNVIGDTNIIDEVIVENNSGILRLPIGPSTLKIVVPASTESEFPVGIPSTVPLILSTNGWLVKNVTLSARVLEGDADVAFQDDEWAVVTDTEIDTVMTITSNEGGTVRIELAAHGRNGSGYGLLTIEAE